MKLTLVIDEHGDGTLVAEIDDGDEPLDLVPDWLDVIEDVSDDEGWTGRRCHAELRRLPEGALGLARALATFALVVG
jgi:hypothetical protein